MKVYFVPLAGSGVQPTPIDIPLGTTTVLGRGPLLKITDDRVSRRQAELQVSSDGLYVKLTARGLNPCYLLQKGDTKPMRMDEGVTLACYNGDQIWLIGIHKYQFLQVPEPGDPQPPSRAPSGGVAADDYGMYGDDDYDDGGGYDDYDDYDDDYDDGGYDEYNSRSRPPAPPPRQRKASGTSGRKGSGARKDSSSRARGGSRAKASKRGPPPAVPPRSHRSGSKGAPPGRKGSSNRGAASSRKKAEDTRRRREEERRRKEEEERRREEERKKREEEEAKEAARAELSAAIESGSPESIEAAIANAKGIKGLKSDISEAKEELDKAYREIAESTVANLEAAMADDDLWAFKDCLDKAKALKKYGLSKEDKTYYEDQFAQWRRQDKAIKAIASAKKMGADGIDKMKKAIKEAKAVQAEVGGLEEHIEDAETALTEMEDAKKKAELHGALAGALAKNRSQVAMTGRFEDVQIPDEMSPGDW